MPSQIAPDTTDGWCTLHQMFAVDWSGIAAAAPSERKELGIELEQILKPWRQRSDDGQSAIYHLLGHKGDLMLLHFRKTLEQCAEFEVVLATLKLNRYLRATTSFLSIVELGMYRATSQVVQEIAEKEIALDSAEGQKIYRERIDGFKKSFLERAYTAIPKNRYCCFYPMNKKRADLNNWYALDVHERARLMLEHGHTGRKYANRIHQVISGSMGFDDWEWGVDLFADDHLEFKAIVSEMRFDEASSKYGEFGPFYVGLRIDSDKLSTHFSPK